MKQETLEEAAENYAKQFDYAEDSSPQLDFIEGAKWKQNDFIQFINKLENESFDGWSEEAISGYLTACVTIKEQFKNK
jgi:hypothetical protein